MIAYNLNLDLLQKYGNFYFIVFNLGFSNRTEHFTRSCLPKKTVHKSYPIEFSFLRKICIVLLRHPEKLNVGECN